MRFSQVLSQLTALLLIMVMASSVAGCQLIGKGKPGQGRTKNTGAPPPPNATASPNAKLIAGDWQVSYSVNGETLSAHMTITPNATGFEGTGTDDINNESFVVDSGFFAGKSLGFNKRYHVDENPNLPACVYKGTIEVVNNATYKGPYMKGNYRLDKVDGQCVQGEWDAQKVEAQQAAENAQPQQPAQPQPPPVAIIDPSKPPDVSGKWNSGYEFMFKTFHSRIFLEQDGTKLTGHGADQNTNESFTITGTYTFPDIKIIHNYPELKLSKKKTKPARNLEFRGKVEVVNEADYQGPRMTGKDIGGGDWMAEEVR